MTSPTEQRRAFDAAMARFQAGDPGGARAAFTAITEQNPAMSDAWVGRLACGDHSLAALAGAHTHSRALWRETRRLGLQDGALQASVPAPLYLAIPVWSRGTIAIAYAAALITAGRYDAAVGVLDDPESAGDPQTALWRQFITAALHHTTGRWSDVCTVTEICPPPGATYVPHELLAATQTVRAMALAALGRPQAAADLLAEVRPVAGPMAADAALTRGWCLRALGDTAGADAAFRSATIDGRLIPQAREALDNPAYVIPTTDADTIASRTDYWDPATETSPSDRRAAELVEDRQEVLARAQARLEALIGLEGPKEQIDVWRSELLIDQVLAAQGQDVAATNENHMVLEGPPGTAKTTFARIVAEILYGLGKIEHPEIVEVSEEDLVVGLVSQTATRMREVCESALGKVLFIDEAYRLAPETEGHSFGKDAINVLLKFMEDNRSKFVVVVAGYPTEMRRFMRANQGLAGRFHFTLTFPSYSPDDIVAIARHHAAQTVKVAVAEAAWPLLHAEATRLRAAPAQIGSGTLLDDAGNGRYANKVVLAGKRERARRLRNLTPQQVAALAQTDPTALVVNDADMRRAMEETLKLAIGT